MRRFIESKKRKNTEQVERRRNSSNRNFLPVKKDIVIVRRKDRKYRSVSGAEKKHDRLLPAIANEKGKGNGTRETEASNRLEARGLV